MPRSNVRHHGPDTGSALEVGVSAGPRLSYSLTAASALLVALGCTFALAAAWYFQLVVGLAPCPLCLDQRIAYYIGVPVAILVLILLSAGYRGLGRLLLGLLALGLAANAVLAGYHAGVEWHFWPGPTACSGGVPVVTGNILEALGTTRVPRCDEAPWAFLGLSMAGWNVLIAAALALIAGWGAVSQRRI